MASKLKRHDIDDLLCAFLQDNSKRWYPRLQPFGKWYCKTSKRFRDVGQMAIDHIQHQINTDNGKAAYKDYFGTLKKYHIPLFDRTYITSIDQLKLNEFDAWTMKRAAKKNQVKYRFVISSERVLAAYTKRANE